MSAQVDPFIGTAHCRWFFFTPAAVPFGMAKPSPSTNAHYGSQSGWKANGYDYRDKSIEGFPAFHEFQIGGVSLMPTVGEVITVPGDTSDVRSGYRSAFSHENETARPGYYSVLLDRYGVQAELTASKRVAYYRFSFPQSDSANILFDIGNRQGESGEVLDASIRFCEDGRLEGFVTTYPNYVRNYQTGSQINMYFCLELDSKPRAVGAFNGRDVRPDEHSASGKEAGLYLTFSTTQNQRIVAKVGLSYTSIENARNNLEAEARRISFDKACLNAHREWEKMLGRIAVEGGSQDNRTKFYTGLFHALLGRGLASDVNGAYPKNDGSVGQIPLDKNGKPRFNHYNTDAIWGGYWDLTQLWTLAYPEYFADWISSQLLVFDNTGWLGDGIACSRYVSGVGTNFTGLTIAAAYNCGIRNYDVQKAYQAALKNELGAEGRPKGAGKGDVGQFTRYGYSPHEASNFSASHTLEYSFSCSAVAQMAKSMGYEQDYQTLSALSKGWELIFDPSTLLMRPRREDGRFLENFDPMQPWRGFQEGNAVQYTYFVPHDIEALIEKVGKEEFTNRLNRSFEISEEDYFGGGTTVDAFSGLQAVYNHGNQPCLQTSWLFNFSGSPALSQKWVRAMCEKFYGTEPVHGYGFGQDEDQGQLGAWFVISSIGLFDVKGLTQENPSFQVGSPLFDKITIKLNKDYYSGKTFSIETRRESPASCYVRAYSLNGIPQDRLSLPLSEYAKGGKMTLTLSERE